MGVGRSCRDRGAGIPLAPQTPPLLVPRTLTPVALGLGVSEGRPCGSAPTAREREEGAVGGGNFVSRRVSRDQKPGDWNGGSWSRYRWGKLPEATAFRALFSVEVKGQSSW